eukprot:IDg9646t1
MPTALSAAVNSTFVAPIVPVESSLLGYLRKTRALNLNHHLHVNRAKHFSPNTRAEMSILREKPRGYQSEILDQARKENVIAFLETGAGKTLVSALLVQEILSKPSSQGKIAVFVVEKVALVHQQAEYMNEVC